ncbi:MAG: adenosine kinase [Pseudomonadota bacterium]
MSRVLGIGNALVDVLVQLEHDELLYRFSLPKGSMQLVAEDFVENILRHTATFTRYQFSGGSAANAIHGLANLGIETGFLGKVCADEFGDFFHQDLKLNKIEPKLFKGKARSGVAMTLITPDTERTFATHLGAAMELCAEDLTNELFANYSYFHIEGYLVQNHSLIKTAASLAKQNGLTVSLDLASYNIVEENLEFLQALVKEHIDIVFANEAEAKAFTGQDEEAALDTLAKLCDIAVVKIGKNGSLIKQGCQKYKVEIIPANCVDTTGAGDLYAAGFLYGLICKKPLSECGRIGSILSGKVIETIGAKMDKQTWTTIKKMIATR